MTEEKIPVNIWTQIGKLVFFPTKRNKVVHRDVRKNAALGYETIIKRLIEFNNLNNKLVNNNMARQDDALDVNFTE